LLKKLLLPIDKYSLNNSKKIICISNNMKKRLVQSRNLPFPKARVISNWQNEEDFIEFRKSETKNKKNFPNILTFMYLGNNGPLAGVDFLIQSFVKAKILDSKLIIAGSGSRTNACKDLVKSLQSSNIEFLSVPRGKVPEIQDKADVMLLPVKKNGAISSIPSKLPAYMFSSKPIIGSLDKESDTARAILESNCGIVVEPENENQLINAMKEVSKWSREVLDDKGKAGFNYAMLHFSKKANLSKVIALINDSCQEFN
jgi:glycosyltransferase involved in cell wall biosynthesis